MRKKFLLLLPILPALLFICLYFNHSRTPNLTIFLNNKQLKKIKPAQGWDTLLKHKAIDDRTPPEMAESLNAISVKPNTVLNLKFNRETEDIELTLWSEKEVNELPAGNAIGVPNKNGIYVYRVVGKWKQGTAIYVFKVNVE